MEPSEHLFRHEAGRIMATLTRIFGTHNLALAEDVVQDAFCRSFEVSKLRGVPENPSAWLKATAKNLRDVFRSGDGTSGIHLIYWHNATSPNGYVTQEPNSAACCCRECLSNAGFTHNLGSVFEICSVPEMLSLLCLAFEEPRSARGPSRGSP